MKAARNELQRDKNACSHIICETFGKYIITTMHAARSISRKCIKQINEACVRIFASMCVCNVAKKATLKCVQRSSDDAYIRLFCRPILN